MGAGISCILAVDFKVGRLGWHYGVIEDLLPFEELEKECAREP